MSDKLEIIQKIHDHQDRVLNGFTTPEKYPGVTTVLGKTKDDTFLLEWRKRIGDAEADRIVKESQRIGTSLDTLVQMSFDDNFEQATHQHEAGYDLYRQLKKDLRRVDPYALQLKVWSDRLRVMGYLDIVGTFDGVCSIIDIKNTRTTKKREYVEDYFLQCTLYSMCIHDLLGLEIKQLVLLIADRSSTQPQVFIERTNKYVPQALRRIRQYRSINTMSS